MKFHNKSLIFAFFRFVFLIYSFSFTKEKLEKNKMSRVAIRAVQNINQSEWQS
jgi:hypothetical protein